MADLLAPYKVMVEEALEEHPFKGPAPLVEAMRYSLLGGGKRLRGVLTLLFAQAVGGKAADALPLAKALEMVHAYSLIHDDLPAMDNDSMRRGKPSCHIAFGEGYACVKGGTDMTRDELTAAGINDSIMHEDFMVGTPDLSVIGVTKDGRRIPVMVDGDFAF